MHLLAKGSNYYALFSRPLSATLLCNLLLTIRFLSHRSRGRSLGGFGWLDTTGSSRTSSWTCSHDFKHFASFIPLHARALQTSNEGNHKMTFYHPLPPSFREGFILPSCSPCPSAKDCARVAPLLPHWSAKGKKTTPLVDASLYTFSALRRARYYLITSATNSLCPKAGFAY